jgi:hypothetical protein
VFVAEEVAEVVDRGQVAQPAWVQQLRAVIGQQIVGVLAVDLVDLTLRLPHRHQLHPRPGHRRRPLRQIRQRRVRSLIKHQQQARVDRCTGLVVADERLGDEVAHQSGEHGSDAMLVAQRCDEIERVVPVEQPVEGDLATRRACFNAWVCPRSHGVAGGRVDAGARSWVGLPLALEQALYLLGDIGNRSVLVIGE